MALHDKGFEDVNETDLLELVAGQVQEGRGLDYKVPLTGKSDSEKREFRCDITSFANATGGHLLFGVDEKGGLAVSVPCLAGINIDAEIQRLDSLAQTAIEPRIPGVRFRAISLTNGNVVVLAVIPPSRARGGSMSSARATSTAAYRSAATRATPSMRFGPHYLANRAGRSSAANAARTPHVASNMSSPSSAAARTWRLFTRTAFGTTLDGTW